MPYRLLRPLLIIEFLIALQAWLAFWSQVGGQYHLDLMFWPWKFCLPLAAAWLTCGITSNMIRNDGSVSRRTIVYASVLVLVMLTAGMVTYYYHLNEPADDENNDTQTAVTELHRITRPGTPLPTPSASRPNS